MTDDDDDVITIMMRDIKDVMIMIVMIMMIMKMVMTLKGYVIHTFCFNDCISVNKFSLERVS